MCDLHREQRPLLCNYISDEELRPIDYIPQCKKHQRPMFFRGRARNNAKGAAAIVSNWPEHWTSSVKYYWVGFGMLSLTIFMIYNTVLALAMLPEEHTKRAHALENDPISTRASSDVFMHLFVNKNEDINLNKYMPYIKRITRKYEDFNYHLTIVLNDTSYESKPLNYAEENNELALQSLLTGDDNIENQNIYKKNVHIDHVTLSKLMDNSPLRKSWRQLPDQFIEFLVRAVSIWDKGGIAFHPVILTPQLSYATYAEKLQNILQKHEKSSSKLNIINKKLNFFKPMKKNKTPVNNIQDVIDALEKEDSHNSSKELLVVAENKLAPIAKENLPSKEVIDIKAKREIRPETRKGINKSVELHNNYESQNETKNGLLPLFLDYLFHHKTNNLTEQKESVNEISKRKPNDNSFTNNTDSNLIETLLNKLNEKNPKKTDEYRPMIISAKGIMNEDTEMLYGKKDISNKCEEDNLTIDLKGNIIATDAACHAFLGTVFSNVIHHTEEETLTDLIIAELSIFCKGLLSSCKGIDVILV